MGDEHEWTKDGIAKALAVRDLAEWAFNHGWDEYTDRQTGEVLCRACGQWLYSLDSQRVPVEQQHHHRPNCVVHRARVALIQSQA
jgi:hypothetical protein